MPLGSAEALALVGMMGSGKSTVARHLGRLLGRPVVSTDARVEALAGKSVARLFAEDGEPAFRALERQVVGALRGPVVVDLGGGSFCDPESAARLLSVARVVFLDVSEAEASRRLGAARPEGAEMAARPLAPRWADLRERRLPLYRRAPLRVETDGRSAEAVARLVHDLLAGPPRRPGPDLQGGLR
jgi:shikimate kinase